eukprot:scaffold311961_cov42-Prasinocladus_malaysianus.AAC.1
MALLMTEDPSYIFTFASFGLMAAVYSRYMAGNHKQNASLAGLPESTLRPLCVLQPACVCVVRAPVWPPHASGVHMTWVWTRAGLRGGGAGDAGRIADV